MKPRMSTGMLAIMLLITGSARAADIGTAFTYQGTLQTGGGPVTDTCDFRFSLWKDATSVLPADQIGADLDFDGAGAIAVEQGAFMVALDFGPGSVGGTARWLDIQVCCPGPCTLEPLAPRVEL